MRNLRVLPICVLILATTGAIFGQSRVTCSSSDYRYQKCPADTARGVRLVEQLSRTACTQGRTWGYDGDGIWVDNGCSAVFEVPSGGIGTNLEELCRREIISEVQRRYGSFARVDFQGIPTVVQIGNWEQRLEGRVQIRDGRNTSTVSYSCWVDTRSGRVRQLDLGVNEYPGNGSAVSACQSQIRNRIEQDERGRVDVSFDRNVRTEPGNRGTSFITGAGWFGRGFSRRDFQYECSVENRSGRVYSADYRTNFGPSGPGGGGYGQCDRFPVLFSDDTFRGQVFNLERSEQDLHSVRFGDIASSVCVPANWTVTLYQDSDFRGDSLVLDGPSEIRDLARDRPAGQNWGDRISSVEVYYQPPTPEVGSCDRYPVLYANDSFRGTSLELTESLSDTHSRGLGDNASSICVPRGWEITVFEDKGFSGSSLTLRGPASILDLKRDRPDGRDWGDRISSVRVTRWR